MRIKDPVWQSCGQIKKIVRLLKGKIRFVGGCVRDSLIGKMPGDIDMATTLKPPAVMGILKKHGFTVLPTGFLYGTVTVLTQSELFPAVEITTLRRDISNDGRRPKVVYTKDWQEDALRRDFTFNALYADFDGAVYDFCEGIRDLENGRVRFIGDPARRISEDYLRILRYFRFLALFDNSPDPETIDACRTAGEHLSGISLDRTKRELFKLTETKNAVRGFRSMHQAGLLENYFPAAGLPVLDGLLRLCPDAGLLIRLLALSVPSVESVDLLVQRWQLSKAQRKEMRHIVLFDRTKPPADYTANDLFRLAVYFKDKNIDEILSLYEAAQPGSGWTEIKEKCRETVVPPFRFSGSDVKDRAEKAKIKEFVGQVYEYWLSTNGNAGRNELLAYARKRFKR
ncbi:MAG: CCA tRNA nucleotidyltransferase [Alphaproteobacteria bacterium]|nr:CCA tRNA nucleotidyltransferase [Alphaproteobacteria bacterium]